MNTKVLFNQIKKKQSSLCVGLDINQDLFPDNLRNDPNKVFNFSKSIIDATARFCVAYKINIHKFQINL